MKSLKPFPKKQIFGEPDHDGTKEFTHLWQLICEDNHPDMFTSTTHAVFRR